MDAIGHYELRVGEGIAYTFVSSGNRDVLKVIRYKLVWNYMERDVYNLGFGDAVDNDPATLTDRSNTNNGDMYKVFNTVLHSIPLFFELHPDAILFATGYDDLRQKVYGRYVKQNIGSLSESYLVLGCYVEEGEITTIEDYNGASEYDGFMVIQRNSLNNVS